MIPQSFINGLVERVDIAEVIGNRVRLKKAGGNQTGLCPFHDEKTPSFHVYPDGHYHCFGCGAHGTTLGFLMEMDGLTFVEAVETLASLVGVEVPREQSDRAPRPETTGLHEVLAEADKRFRGWLRRHAEGPAAVAYLKGRGLAGDVARDYGIGLAPSGWESLKTALAHFDEDKLVAAGLLVKNAEGRIYDRFRARIVFPIRDTRGRVIGFGGRIYDGSGAGGEGPREDEPKYLNSPESPVFRKSEELYGLFEARRAKRHPDSLVVVEGYMDVAGLAAHGYREAVATLGTAVGEAHFKRLFRHVDRLVCCFDGDAAGRAAAWKAVDAAFPTLSARRELRFVFLPEGEDPDTVARRQGAAHFRALVANAVPVGEYFLEYLQRGLDLARVDQRATLCDLALPHIARLPDGSLRSLLVRSLAERAETDAEVLERRLRVPAASQPPQRSGPAQGARKLADNVLHRLVKRPSSFAKLPTAQREQLASAPDMLGEVAQFLAAQPDADTAVLLGRFLGEPAYDQLSELASRPLALEHSEDALRAEFADSVRRLLAASDERQRRALIEQARQSESLEDLRLLRDSAAANATAAQVT